MSRLAAPAIGISILALVISFSGGAYAVTQLAANSVGTAQIKDNAVTAPKIANGAVTRFKIASGAVNGSRVADNSLTGADIDESTLHVPGSAAGAVTLAGVDFHPRDSTVTNGYAGAGGIYQSSVATGFFVAALDLPQGAVIGAVTVHVVDGDATNDVIGILTRFDPSTQGSEDLRFANTSGASGFQALDVPGVPVSVNNRVSAYELQVRLGGQGSSTVLQGATVSYSTPK
jgi:hypothetical protein